MNVGELTLEQKEVVMHAHIDPVPRELSGLATPDRAIQIRCLDYPGSLPDRSHRTAYEQLVPAEPFLLLFSVLANRIACELFQQSQGRWRVKQRHSPAPIAL